MTKQTLTNTQDLERIPLKRRAILLLIDVDRRVLFGPLENEVATEQVRVLERGVRVLRLVAGEELEEGETTRAVVELLRETNGFELAVRT